MQINTESNLEDLNVSCENFCESISDDLSNVW